MCKHCWDEKGSPAELPSNFEQFKKLHDEIYETDLAGGRLHIQLDDMNLDDHNVLPTHWEKDLTPTELACLVELRKMTEAQRYASMAKIEGWI